MSGRYVCSVLVVVLGCLCLVACGSREGSVVDENMADRAKEFVDLLAAGEFSGAAERLDSTMAQAMPPSKLEEAWGSLAALGEYQGQSGVRTAREQGFQVAYVTCQFTKGATDVKVVFNAEGKVSGLWFVPPGS